MKNKIKLLLCLAFSLMMCGCWNYSEINSLAIATTIGIDKKDNKYLVSLMMANAKSAQASSKEGQSQTVVFEGTGDTLSEALEIIDLKSPKKIYLNHVSVIVLSEKVAKEGVTKIADLLIRAPESRKKFYLLISNNAKANEILKILTPLEGLPSQNISSMIEGTTTYQGIANSTKYSNFINDVIERGDQPSITSINIIGNESKGDDLKNLEKSDPEALLKLGPLAIFKDDKLLGFANKKESEGINILNNRVRNMIVKIKCDNNYIVGHLDKLMPIFEIKLINNKPQVTINISADGSIKEINCNRDLTDVKVVDEIQKNLEYEVENIINDGINAAQNKYHSDVLKLGLRFYRKYPRYFKTVDKKWDSDIFPNIDIKLNVDLDIKTKGSLEQTIRKEEK